ncbi:MAG: RIP metalloprotease RseP [Bacteroidetes bacterium]|nr:RIP metalloprotease RseP [Bacteroidota bacterium]
MIKFTLFFLSLSLLIVLHEFGHFITARLFKMRVNKFYLFFDFLFPIPALLNFSLFKKKIGETTYGLGWFPFGGYVDIHGMQAEEGTDANAVPAPDEFRAKKPWQRLIVLAGGITVNFLLAIVIYSMVAWAWGDEYLPAKNAKYGLYYDSLLLNLGAHHGDKLVSIDNAAVDNLGKATLKILLDKPKTIQLDHNGKIISINIPKGFTEMAVQKEVKALFTEEIPYVIDSVVANMPAGKAGLMKGDSLISIDGDSLHYAQHFVDRIQKSKGKKFMLGFIRNGKSDSVAVTVNEEGKIGILGKGPDQFLQYKTISYGFFAAWGRGFDRTIETLSSYVKQLGLLFSKVGASKIGGFATIGGLFPSTWDWEAFWNITAFLSVILAFMNLLPIPVLDGGYILFVLYEMITRKKVSDKFMQRALAIGMYLVLALLIYANGNDIIRAFHH